MIIDNHGAARFISSSESTQDGSANPNIRVGTFTNTVRITDTPDTFGDLYSCDDNYMMVSGPTIASDDKTRKEFHLNPDSGEFEFIRELPLLNEEDVGRSHTMIFDDYVLAIGVKAGSTTEYIARAYD